MAPEQSAGADLSLRRRRLRYRAWHRGTRELDLLIGPFVDAMTPAMDADELDRLERLLNEPETDLQAWLLGQGTPPPDAADTDLIERIVSFKLANKSP